MAQFIIKSARALATAHPGDLRALLNEFSREFDAHRCRSPYATSPQTQQAFPSSASGSQNRCAASYPAKPNSSTEDLGTAGKLHFVPQPEPRHSAEETEIAKCREADTVPFKWPEAIKPEDPSKGMFTAMQHGTDTSAAAEAIESFPRSLDCAYGVRGKDGAPLCWASPEPKRRNFGDCP